MTFSHDLALVTGASGGLGAHFCHALARRGWNLAVTGRREAKLEALRDELEEAHGIAVTPLVRDLAVPGAAAGLMADLDELGAGVRVLINNAGVGHYGPLVAQPPESVEAILRLNLAAGTELSQIVAARMAADGAGHILHVASVASFAAVPRTAVYAASKAYVLSLAMATRYELRKSGVGVTALCPGLTRSDFFDTAGYGASAIMRALAMPPDRVAEKGVAGLFAGRAVIVPGLVNKFFDVCTRVLPRATTAALASAVVKDRGR